MTTQEQNTQNILASGAVFVTYIDSFIYVFYPLAAFRYTCPTKYYYKRKFVNFDELPSEKLSYNISNQLRDNFYNKYWTILMNNGKKKYPYIIASDNRRIYVMHRGAWGMDKGDGYKDYMSYLFTQYDYVNYDSEQLFEYRGAFYSEANEELLTELNW